MWDVSVFSAPHRGAEAGLDDPRGHAVHSDVILGQLGGQSAGQPQQSGLTHAVRTQSLQRRRRGVLNAGLHLASIRMQAL